MIVRNPRKQIQRTLLSTLNKSGKLSENVLKEMWEFALKNYGTDRAFTLEEILLCGMAKASRRRRVKRIGKFDSFDRILSGEIRRPFMYHALSVEAFDELESKVGYYGGK